MKHGRNLIKTGLAALSVVALLTTSACDGNAANTADGKASSMLLAADAGSPTFQRNFNPFSANKRTATNYVYEPLQVVNTLDGKETPFLATGYKVDNPRTLVFTIRQGVKWSDGKPFTAADVKYTFQLIKKNSALDTRGVWQHLASLDVKGNKVTFHLKSADIPAAYTIEQQVIVPQHIWKNVNNPVTYKDANPVGTGPYMLDKFSPNQYSMKKNPKYWQADKVAVKELVLPAASGAVDIVKNQQGYDWAYAFISDVKGTWVKADPKHNSYWFPPGGTVAMYPNLNKAPFNNLNFRLGVSYALDRDSIAKHAEEGTVKAAGMSGLLLPNQKAYLNSKLPNNGAIKQDTAKALKYFKKAGYTKSGKKMVDSQGKQLSFTITVAHGYNDWLRGVQTIRQQLGAIGIDVKVNQPQPAGYTEALNNGDFQMIMSAFSSTGSVYQDFNNLLNSSFAKPAGQSTTANFERFKNQKVDSLLDQLQRTKDTAAKKKIVEQIQGIFYKKTPVISLFYGGLWGLFSTKHFTGFPSADNPYAPPTPYTESALMVFTHVKPVS